MCSPADDICRWATSPPRNRFFSPCDEVRGLGSALSLMVALTFTRFLFVWDLISFLFVHLLAVWLDATRRRNQEDYTFLLTLAFYSFLIFCVHSLEYFLMISKLPRKKQPNSRLFQSETQFFSAQASCTGRSRPLISIFILFCTQTLVNHPKTVRLAFAIKTNDCKMLTNTQTATISTSISARLR